MGSDLRVEVINNCCLVRTERKNVVCKGGYFLNGICASSAIHFPAVVHFCSAINSIALGTSFCVLHLEFLLDLLEGSRQFVLGELGGVRR